MKAVSCQVAYANRTSFRSNRSVATSASQELTLTSNQLLAVAGNNSSLFTLREHRRADFTSVFMVTSPCQILSPPNSPSCRLALNVVHSLQWFANATARPPPLSSPDVSDSCCCNFCINRKCSLGSLHSFYQCGLQQPLPCFMSALHTVTSCSQYRT